MNRKNSKRPAMPCLCSALRQASRAVSRLYDDELRSAGIRTTQYTLLRRLRRTGEERQRDLGDFASLDQTTLTRSLQLLIDAGWVAVRAGKDRRERLIRLTVKGVAKLEAATPAWERAQERLRSRMKKRTWNSLLNRLLPDLTQLAEGE
jgi:DNA-binding MarR family transcriptional regulator